MYEEKYPSSFVIELAQKVRNRVVELEEEEEGNYADGTLGGFCAIASRALWAVLRRHGFKPEFKCARLVDRGLHCWIELEGYIIDITATQFGSMWDNEEYPDIYITTPQMSELHQHARNLDEREPNKWGFRNPRYYADWIRKIVVELSPKE
jgi:hypothetical protein